MHKKFLILLFGGFFLTACEVSENPPLKDLKTEAAIDYKEYGQIGGSYYFDAYIERPEGEISLEEWENLVDATPELRIKSGDVVVQNPKDESQSLMFPNSGNVTEYYDSTSEEWTPLFYWFPSGRILFGGSDSFLDEESDYRKFTGKIAEKLNAQLIDEYGTHYKVVQ